MDLNACPECGKRIYRDDFQCANCGLLLHPEQGTGVYILTDPAIVRAMLSPNEPRSSTEELLLPEGGAAEVVTASYPLPLLSDACPQLIARLDHNKKPLQPYEAHVASFIDGETPVPELARLSKVPIAEVRAVIVSLFARGMVDFESRKAERVREVEPKLEAEPVPIEEVPTSRRARKPKLPPALAPKLAKTVDAPVLVVPEQAKRPPSKKLSDALDELQTDAAAAGKPMTLFGRPAVEKALEEAKARKSGQAAPLQARTAVLLDTPEEHLQRAVSLERAGQVDGAIYVLRRAIEKVKKPAPLFNKLALILLDKRKDYRQAESLLRLAMKAEPSNSVYQQNLYKVLALAAQSGSGKIPAAGLWSKLRGK